MNRKLLVGCGLLVVGVVAAIVIAAFVFAPRLAGKAKKWIGAQMADATRRAAIENKWRPPSATLDANWFPQTVGEWTLTVNEETPGLPELNVQRAGRRGKYRGAQQDVEVTILPANDLEKDAIFSRAKSALESGGSGSRVISQTPGRLYVCLDGKHHTRLWWAKDFLFIFRTDGPENPDGFAEEFLSAMTLPELEAR